MNHSGIELKQSWRGCEVELILYLPILALGPPYLHSDVSYHCQARDLSPADGSSFH